MLVYSMLVYCVQPKGQAYLGEFNSSSFESLDVSDLVESSAFGVFLTSALTRTPQFRVRPALVLYHYARPHVVVCNDLYNLWSYIVTPLPAHSMYSKSSIFLIDTRDSAMQSKLRKILSRLSSARTMQTAGSQVCQ